MSLSYQEMTRDARENTTHNKRLRFLNKRQQCIHAPGAAATVLLLLLSCFITMAVNFGASLFTSLYFVRKSSPLSTAVSRAVLVVDSDLTVKWKSVSDAVSTKEANLEAASATKEEEEEEEGMMDNGPKM